VRYFYDIGANVGQTFDWFLSQNDYADHHIVCFEPSPRHYQALLQNVLKWRGCFQGVTLCPFAVTGAQGTSGFYETESPLADSLDPTMRRCLHRFDNIIVATIPLAYFIQRHTKFDDRIEIKIDAEGAEYDILEQLLRCEERERVHTIHVEWHGDDNPWFRRDQIERAMRKYGIIYKEWKF
jgi:FkbM family methyltransferase